MNIDTDAAINVPDQGREVVLALPWRDSALERRQGTTFSIQQTGSRTVEGHPMYLIREETPVQPTNIGALHRPGGFPRVMMAHEAFSDEFIQTLPFPDFPTPPGKEDHELRLSNYVKSSRRRWRRLILFAWPLFPVHHLDYIRVKVQFNSATWQGQTPSPTLKVAVYLDGNFSDKTDTSREVLYVGGLVATMQRHDDGSGGLISSLYATAKFPFSLHKEQFDALYDGNAVWVCELRGAYDTKTGTKVGLGFGEFCEEFRQDEDIDQGGELGEEH